MKKLFSLLLVLGLSLVLVSGCSQLSQTPTEVPDGSDLATQVGGMMSLATKIDATALSLIGASAVSGSVQILAASDLIYSNGWWRFTYTSGAYSYTYQAKAYTALGVEITDESGLSNTNKLEIVLTLTMGSSITYNFGTDASPLTFDGILSGTKSLNGTVAMAMTEGSGKSYNITMVYSGVTLDSSGLPASGTTTFTFTSSDYATVAATITYNGNETATLTYTEPASLSGTSYTIDLLTGSVS
jgi:hypothetical protein